MRKVFSFRKSGLLLIILVSVSLSFILASKPEPVEGCTNNEGSLTKEITVPETARMIQEKYSASLMDIPEVIGTALSLTRDGRECILVLAKKDISTSCGKAFLPDHIENIPVRIMVTGDLNSQEMSLMKILMPTLILGC